MRKLADYTIEKEPFEDMLKAQRFNPCLEITFKSKTGKHTHKLSDGYSDEIYVYCESGEIYVLTQNNNLGYVGLEVFFNNEKIGEIFIESYQKAEVFIQDDHAPFTIIKKLNNYINPQ